MGGGGSTRRRDPDRFRDSGDDSDGVPPEVSIDEDEAIVGDICIIEDRATLASLNPVPLGSVSTGDVLDVDLQNSSIQVTNDAGQAVGAITESWVGLMKDCIKNGYVYEAEVLSKNSGRCEVLVRNK